MKKAKLVKNNVQNKKETVENTVPELRKLAYIFGALLVVFLVFYAIAAFKVKKNKEKNTTTPEEVVRTIQYDEILTANMLNQSKEEYYVLVYKDTEEFDTKYRSFINMYIADEDALRFYYSDLNNIFNKRYLVSEDETSHLQVGTMQDLRVKTTTLFHIKNGKISNTYEGSEAIFNQFKALILTEE